MQAGTIISYSSDVKVLPSVSEQGELILSGDTTRDTTRTQHCLNGKENLFHLEFTSADFRRLKFLSSDLKGKPDKNTKCAFCVCSCASNLDGSRNMAALMYFHLFSKQMAKTQKYLNYLQKLSSKCQWSIQSKHTRFR